MEQSQLPEEVARLNEELSNAKAELKEEREKLANNQQLDHKTSWVRSLKLAILLIYEILFTSSSPNSHKSPHSKQSNNWF